MAHLKLLSKHEQTRLFKQEFNPIKTCVSLISMLNETFYSNILQKEDLHTNTLSSDVVHRIVASNSVRAKNKQLEMNVHSGTKKKMKNARFGNNYSSN